MENRRVTQFTDKYKKSGKIGAFLLKRFFSTISNTIPGDVSSVAEIGCGAGYSTDILRGYFNREVPFFASDVDPELVKIAGSKNNNVSFSTESIYKLNSADNSFDLVFCLEVMEHLENPEEALKELRRVAKKYALISVPREPLWRILNMCRGSYLKDLGNTPGHINHWSKSKMGKFVSKEFDIINIKSSIPWTIVLAKKK